MLIRLASPPVLDDSKFLVRYKSFELRCLIEKCSQIHVALTSLDGRGRLSARQRADAVAEDVDTHADD